MNVEWRAQFGPFTLSPAKRLLEQDGAPVRLGGRALDVLIALVASAGEVVGKRELLARVWPNMVVEEGSLRYHIVAIRKALGDSSGQPRYIVNVANQGYSFVAPVTRSAPAAPPVPAAASASPPAVARLPALSAPVVGRDADVAQLTEALGRYRLVSVVGAGGIGKTTVAIATLHAACAAFDGDVHFIDFSCITDTALIHSAMAGAIGMAHCADDQRALEAHLAGRRALLVLDCCEHLIDDIARLAESMLRNCPGLRLLATSREVLRVTGEYVHRLQPLACPPDGDGETGAAALTYPAVKLFVERAAAAGGVGFTLSDADAPLVSRLCRDLDGIALAIELAASRIEALGLRAITEHFDAGASLSWPGRRTANARHQTLRATLDWSVKLLPAQESLLLRRLSVFTGTFSLDAAIAVCCPDQQQFAAIELLANLVSKSLVAVEAGGASRRYRLLDTTRHYCHPLLRESGELAAVSQRHAGYFSQRIAHLAGHPDLAAQIGQDLPNWRAALEWHLGGDQPGAAGELAALACPLLLQHSQLVECARWAQAALRQLPPALAGTALEMRLQRALGQSLMFLGSGRKGRADAAYRHAIALAGQLGDHDELLQLLSGQLVLLHREGAYTEALAVAHKAQALVADSDDPQARFMVDALMGVCLHLDGQVQAALGHWDNCFRHAASAPHILESRAGFEYHVRALCGRTRTLWLTGQPAQACALADDTIARARQHGHAVSYSLALIWAGSVYGQAEDIARLHAVADELERVGKQHSLDPYRHAASILYGHAMLLQGQPAAGVERIRDAIEALHHLGYEMLTSMALTVMARGLSDLALHAAALSTCDEAEATIRRGGDLLRLPELLTTRGQCQARMGRGADAEHSFLEALALARRQGAWSEQLRAGVALAALRAADGRAGEVAPLLQPLVDVAPDQHAPDLARARALLARHAHPAA